MNETENAIRDNDVDVGAELDNAPLGLFQWSIVALCAMVTFIDGYDLVAMGIVVPTLSQEWSLQPSEFSVALSAALVGVLGGSALAGWMGDKIGRRLTLAVMVLLAAIFMAATPAASTVTELAVYRFLTGVGAGGSIPVAIAYTSEFVPAARRNALVTLMYAGAPLGSVLGGAVGPFLISHGGWQGVFWFGGLISAIAFVAIILALPESLRFVALKGSNTPHLIRALRRLHPARAYPESARYVLAQTADAKQGVWKDVVGRGPLGMTLTLWIVFIAMQFIIFLMGLWLPTIFVGQGMPLQDALYTVAIYNLGGALGGPLAGWLGDRIGARTVLLLGFPSAAAAIGLLGFAHYGNAAWIVAFVAGLLIIGCSICLGALAATLYPVHARSTGVGLALGLGRFGAIVAPLIGGIFIARGDEAFFSLAIAGCTLGFFGLVVLGFLVRPGRLTKSVAPESQTSRVL